MPTTVVATAYNTSSKDAGSLMAYIGIDDIPLIILNISQFKSRKKCFQFLETEFKTNLESLIRTMAHS